MTVPGNSPPPSHHVLPASIMDCWTHADWNGACAVPAEVIPGATSTVAILNDTWNFEKQWKCAGRSRLAQKADERRPIRRLASLFSRFRSG